MSYNADITGLITDIGHGTMRDGPGWRSIVYFKGCNFCCAWCGSPETMNAVPELMYFPDRLKYAARAAAACPRAALDMAGNQPRLDRTRCGDCATFDCARMCVDGAFERAGRSVSVGEVVDEILPFQRAHARYGVTLSGGEAPLQWAFYLELLKALKHHGFHTALETNGSIDRMPESFPLLDHIIIDLKHVDPAEHKRLTGCGNATTLANIGRASAARLPLWVRIPLVPGLNDGPNIDASIAFLLPYKENLSVEILGYHKLGIYKWHALNRGYTLETLEPPAETYIHEIESRFRGAGIEIHNTQT